MGTAAEPRPRRRGAQVEAPSKVLSLASASFLSKFPFSCRVSPGIGDGDDGDGDDDDDDDGDDNVDNENANDDDKKTMLHGDVRIAHSRVLQKE